MAVRLGVRAMGAADAPGVSRLEALRVSQMIDLRAAARARRITLEEAPGLRAAALENWSRRMRNEYTSHRVFLGLAQQLAALGGSGSLGAGDAEECRRFAEEERKHGVLCGAVVESLGGDARFVLSVAGDFPMHHDAPGLEAVLRNVLSICCLSETVAVALIGAERLEMSEGPLRQLLSEILADEVGHARFGWRFVARHLSGVGEAERARLGQYLALAFESLEAHELAHISASDEEPGLGRELGLCQGAAARQLFYETVAEVIVPQLEALGLEASTAWHRRRDPGCA